MRIAPPSWQPDTAAEPEVLIREARRRQRRRWLSGGVASVVLLASVVGVVAGLSGHRHSGASSRSHPAKKAAARHAVATLPPIPPSIGTTLVMWPAGFGQCCGAVEVDNLSTGHLTQSQEPDISLGDYQPLLAQVGSWLVYVGDGATAIRNDLAGHPRVLGPTFSFAPAATPGRVWLFKFQHGMRGRLRAWTVALSGGRRSQPVTLPAGAYLPAITGTDAGLLLQSSQGLVLWNPGTAPRRLPSSPVITDGFDATSRLVSYGTSCNSHVTARNALWEPNAGYDACKTLQVLDVVTGKLISFAAPPGTAGWVPGGFSLVSAISHDGDMIAAYAATRPQGEGWVRLYVMRIARPSRPATPVPSSAAYLFARTAWSPNDKWLLYQGPGGHLRAYQVTSGRTGASSTTCCRYTVMVAVPSRNG